MDNKERPKFIDDKVKCKNCEYYESPDWKPWWGERYCHHPSIFRIGLTNMTPGCECYKENVRNCEEDFVVYFRTCIEKDYLVMNKDITLRYMKEALESYEKLKNGGSSK